MPAPQSRRLDSWKAIAEYLGRSVRTTIRWSDERGLPVRRIPGGKRHAVFAFTNEIDTWLLGTGSNAPVAESVAEPARSVEMEGSSDAPTAPTPELSHVEPLPFTRNGDPPEVPTPDRQTRRVWTRKTRRILVGASLFIGFVASAVVLVVHPFHARASANTRRVTIAVLPVRNLTGNLNRENFAGELTEELISELGGLNPQKMGVIAGTSSMSYRDTNKTVAQIGRELSVDYVLETNVRGDLNQFTYGVQLIRTNDLAPLWKQNFDGDTSNLALVEYELTRDVARKIGVHERPEFAVREERQLTIKSDSRVAYLQGRHFWNEGTGEGLRNGLEHFQQAVEEDPENALAYSGMADSYNMLVSNGFSSGTAGIVKAEESAQHALQLDPSLAEAHASLAYVNLMWTWEWPAAEREFRRAIELDANYVPAHHWYAFYLASMGRHAEADEEIRTALKLDPSSATIQSAAAYLHYFARQYDSAIQECQAALRRDPGLVVARSVLGLSYEAKAQYPQAVAEFRKVDELVVGRVPAYRGQLGHAYALAGNLHAARQMLAEIDQMAMEGSGANQFSKAVIYAGLGEKQNALQALERAQDQNEASMLWLKVDSRFDSLREEPRFRGLINGRGRVP